MRYQPFLLYYLQLVDGQYWFITHEVRRQATPACFR